MRKRVSRIKRKRGTEGERRKRRDGGIKIDRDGDIESKTEREEQRVIYIHRERDEKFQKTCRKTHFLSKRCTLFFPASKTEG